MLTHLVPPSSLFSWCWRCSSGTPRPGTRRSGWIQPSRPRARRSPPTRAYRGPPAWCGDWSRPRRRQISSSPASSWRGAARWSIPGRSQALPALVAFALVLATGPRRPRASRGTPRGSRSTHRAGCATPLLADGGGEAELEDQLRLVGGRQHRAEQPVELVVVADDAREAGCRGRCRPAVEANATVELQVALSATAGRSCSVGTAAQARTPSAWVPMSSRTGVCSFFSPGRAEKRAGWLVVVELVGPGYARSWAAGSVTAAATSEERARS